MAIKKSQLYSSLWASCDELRGGMDASQYKDYVLVLLFVKYVSDKLDNATSALARMNMVLHDFPTAEIWQANTLAAPHFKNADGLKTLDFVVANPPFSNKNWTSGLDAANDLYGRFEYGIPPAKNGDYAFLLHML
jgi:type I restriction-modification system DNA methylase subunit